MAVNRSPLTVTWAWASDPLPAESKPPAKVDWGDYVRYGHPDHSVCRYQTRSAPEPNRLYAEIVGDVNGHRYTTWLIFNGQAPGSYDAILTTRANNWFSVKVWIEDASKYPWDQISGGAFPQDIPAAATINADGRSGTVTVGLTHTGGLNGAAKRYHVGLVVRGTWRCGN
jgi:hypothetical protein